MTKTALSAAGFDEVTIPMPDTFSMAALRELSYPQVKEFAMGQSRNPGPQGIGSARRIDDGTLMLARSPTRGISISGQPGGKQGISRSRTIRRAEAYADRGALIVAEVYFPTDVDVLDKQDVYALTPLIDSLKILTKGGFRATLLCTGGADHRASSDYNKRLGKRRAVSVASYIRRHVGSTNLGVFLKSIGEDQAAQPRGRQKVPARRLMEDRKVTVVLGPDALQPPIKISVTGNWILNSSIEKTEINNQGRVVAHPGSTGAQSVKEESDYMGRIYDPELPVATVRTNYSVAKINGQDEASVHCAVVYNKTGAVLFRASARTNSREVIREHLQYNPANPRVKRVIDPKSQTPFPGYVVEESKVKGVNMRALHLFDNIYSQLKGRHKNITERVKAELTP